jgi:hypothetical protein
MTRVSYIRKRSGQQFLSSVPQYVAEHPVHHDKPVVLAKHRHAEVVHIYLPGDEQFVEIPSGSVPV